MRKYFYKTALFLILFFQFFNFSQLLYSSASAQDSLLLRVKDKLIACKPFERTPKNSVILRIDDIQAGYLHDTQIRMAEDAFEIGAPVTFGIIPKDLASDRVLTNFIRENSCNIEVALHGLNHDTHPPEFESLTYEEAAKKIVHGKYLFKEALKIDPIIFIPPENVYSEGTLEALATNGFKVVSAGQGNYYDYSVAMHYFEEGNDDFTHDVDYILDYCLGEFSAGRTCIIMLHPQEFATNDALDEEKYARYLDLLAKLKEKEANFIGFMDLYNWSRKM